MVRSGVQNTGVPASWPRSSALSMCQRPSWRGGILGTLRALWTSRGDTKYHEVNLQILEGLLQKRDWIYFIQVQKAARGIA